MTTKLYPITCSCGATIHVAADAREHVQEMRDTIREWEKLIREKNARIAALERENEELRLGLLPEEVTPPLGFVDGTWKQERQLRLFQ